MNQEYAVCICSRKRPEMFWKILHKAGIQPHLVVAGINPSEAPAYINDFDSKEVHWTWIRKTGIGPAREAVRKAVLKLFPKVKYFLWLDDKTSVREGLLRGLEILIRNKKIGIVCGTSELIRFFTKAKDKQKLWGATLMWVRREVMEKNKFLPIRSYEDKAFMLGAIKDGWLVANDYKMDYSGPRHLKGGTSSHRGLDKKHVLYAMRIIKKAVGSMITKMILKKKKDKGVWAISMKYSKEVLDKIISIGG